jgi:hypothetical protein
MDPEKVDTWKTPTSHNLLRGFIVSVGYLDDNVKVVRKPMDIPNHLIGDTVVFCCGPTQQRAFDEVKGRVAAHRKHCCVAMKYSTDTPPVHLIMANASVASLDAYCRVQPGSWCRL